MKESWLTPVAVRLQIADLPCVSQSEDPVSLRLCFCISPFPDLTPRPGVSVSFRERIAVGFDGERGFQAGRNIQPFPES